MKTAVILFADTPLLEQAGNSLKEYFPAATKLNLYCKYVDDSITYFEKQKSDLWFTCEESFQETLLLQHFPLVKGCKIVRGTMEEKLTTLTDYFLNFKEYDHITFLFQPFTFLWPEVQAQIEQAFRRTGRSVVLLTENDTFSLPGLSVSFPFSQLYEDIIWEKPDRYQHIKDHCQDASIPCKRIKAVNMSLLPIETISQHLSTQLEKHYPQFFRTLQLALRKKA